VRKATFESGLILSAGTLEELAATMKAVPAVLIATVQRYNGFVSARHDEDFGRFGPNMSNIPPKIETPPFYAAPFYPMTRKSMGGSGSTPRLVFSRDPDRRWRISSPSAR
jgi:fumarate reductase flavoprotein subunit